METALANQILLKTISGIESAGDFLKQEIPDVLQQLLMWHLISSLISFTFSIIFILSCLYFVFKTYIPWLKKGLGDGRELSCVLFLIPISLLAAWFIESFVWLKILLAPKLYLLEYGASLLK